MGIPRGQPSERRVATSALNTVSWAGRCGNTACKLLRWTTAAGAVCRGLCVALENCTGLSSNAIELDRYFGAVGGPWGPGGPCNQDSRSGEVDSALAQAPPLIDLKTTPFERQTKQTSGKQETPST